MYVLGPGLHRVALWAGKRLGCCEGISIERISGSEDAALLTNDAARAWIIEQKTGPGTWDAIEVLEQGATAVVGPSMRFYPEGMKEKTYEIAQGSSVENAEPTEASVPAAEGRRSAAVTIGGIGAVLDESDDDVYVVSVKRQRIEGSGTAGPGPSSEDQLRCPFSLLRVQGLPPACNAGSLGARLNRLLRGEMEWCLVSNYMVDMALLFSECPDLRRAGKVILVHGERAEGASEELEKEMRSLGMQGRMTVFRPWVPDFGTHHSKFFLVKYATGIRVIVHTANLVYPDLNNKTQGIYVQDFPLKSEEPSEEDAPSCFEADLLEYLGALRIPAGDARLVQGDIKRHDMSSARVRIVGSVPLCHQGANLTKWGHMKLRQVLSELRFPDRFRSAPVACQFSSIGSLNEKWLTGEFLASASAGMDTSGALLGTPRPGREGLQLVWPTEEEVRWSVEGWMAGASIPGSEQNVSKAFLRPLWHRWGGAPVGRQRAMPHIKSLVRYRIPEGRASGSAEGGGGSGGGKSGSAAEVAWFLLTSHNLSKAAWGQLEKGGTQISIRSYELGVLFTADLERDFLLHPHRHFSCTPEAVAYVPGDPTKAYDGTSEVLLSNGGVIDLQGHTVKLPVPYSLPPKPYTPECVPWMMKSSRLEPDALGHIICND